MRKAALIFFVGMLALLFGCSSEDSSTENPDPTFLRFDINQVAETFQSSDFEERNLWFLQASGYEEPVERELLGEALDGLPPECQLLRGERADASPSETAPSMVTIQAEGIDSTVPVGAGSRIRVGTVPLERVQLIFEATANRPELTVEGRIPPPADSDFDVLTFRWTGPVIDFDIRANDPLYFSLDFEDSRLECDGLTDSEFELDLVANDLIFDPIRDELTYWKETSVDLDFEGGSEGILTLRTSLETAATASCYSLPVEYCKQVSQTAPIEEPYDPLCYVASLAQWDEGEQCYGNEGRSFCLGPRASGDGHYYIIELEDGTCHASGPLYETPADWTVWTDGERCGCDVDPGSPCGLGSPVYCE